MKDTDSVRRGKSQNHSIKLEFQDNEFLPFLYGHHNSNLTAIEQALDVSLDSFGNIIKITGSEHNTSTAKVTIEALYKRIANTTTTERDISSSMVKDALRWAADASNDGMKAFANSDGALDTWRKVVTPKSAGQQTYLEALSRHDVVFGLGPAGTGKTYLAVAKAVEALKAKRIERIVLSRPAVEAGERLGFLPGDMKEKVDPYLRPLYDSLYDMMPPDMVDRMLASGQIEIAPLAFMRGRTLAQSYVIIDEAQNTTPVQMKMVLTRLGDDSRMVITGDLSQVDLPSGQKSGLDDAVSILDDVKGVGIIRLKGSDVVRHPVVARILTAYEKRDQS
ncbi:MAG: PhoH family protein [Alphaproteobacteria bacterium]|nr:PhoH family protein [Alphaproteobacteria bacterium]